MFIQNLGEITTWTIKIKISIKIKV